MAQCEKAHCLGHPLTASTQGFAMNGHDSFTSLWRNYDPLFFAELLSLSNWGGFCAWTIFMPQRLGFKSDRP